MKVITAAEAAALIGDGLTVGIGGSGSHSAPDEILMAMAERFEREGSPRSLLLLAGIAPGDLSEDGFGLSIIRAPGLIGGIYAGHVGMSPAIGRAVGTNKIAGYCVPLGVYVQVLKAIAGGQPGVVSHVGLHTFADPRVEGCLVNGLARGSGRKVVSLMEIEGKEFL